MFTWNTYTKAVREAEQKQADQLGGAPILSPVVEMQRLVVHHIGEESLAVPADMFWRFMPVYDAVLEQQKQMVMISAAYPQPNRMVCGVWVYPESADKQSAYSTKTDVEIAAAGSFNYDALKALTAKQAEINRRAEIEREFNRPNPTFNMLTKRSAVPAKAAEQPKPKPKIADKPLWDMRLDDYRACIAAMARPYEF